MTIFTQPLWGYALEFPEGWTHKTIQDTEGFAPIPEALTPGYEGENSGHLLLRAEWNCTRQQIEPIWKEHIGKVSGFIGAKQVGSAPWQMAGGVGFEAEIQLPKKDPRRLWTGILERGYTVLHLMVAHPKEDRKWFEPIATETIKSLRFLDAIPDLDINSFDLPLPPGLNQVDPNEVIDDIQDLEDWLAYEGKGNVGALQAFYLRELDNYGWDTLEYVPYPSTSDLGFARLQVRKEEQTILLGLLPSYEAGAVSTSRAKIAIKRQ